MTVRDRRKPIDSGVLVAALVLAAVLLAGCASSPRAPAVPPESAGAALPQPATDGPPANPPPDLASTPDAEPRIEPVRAGGPNKPYEVLGQRYTPQLADEAFEQEGLASWYGRKFHGRRTASGEIYDMFAMSAAHRTLPIPSYALVRNPRNGREVVVRINDRGPFKNDWIVDLSYAAAVKLGVERGVAPVQLRRLTQDEIASGRWRSSATVAAAAAQSPSSPRAAASTVTPTAAASPPPAAAGADPPRVAAPAAAPLPSAADTAVAAVRPAVPEAPAAEATQPLAADGSPTPATSDPQSPATQADAAPSKTGRFWLQFGAFSRREGAVALYRQLTQELDWLAHALTIFDERDTWRVQAGPYPSRSAAMGALQRIRASAASLQPPVVKLR